VSNFKKREFIQQICAGEEHRPFTERRKKEEALPAVNEENLDRGKSPGPLPLEDVN